MAHIFNPSTGEAGAGGSLSSRPTWTTEEFPDSQSCYIEKRCLEKQTNKQELSGSLLSTSSQVTDELPLALDAMTSSP